MNDRRNHTLARSAFRASSLAAMSGTLLGALTVCMLPGAAQAQPVVDLNLGSIANSPSYTFVSSQIVINASNPVRWFQITVPTIRDDKRFFDISTDHPGAFDTEIALYAPDGTLIATDDDEGAALYSALTFGISDPNTPLRVHPLANPGQSAGELNNGRDGDFRGPWPAQPLVLGPTTATYYIAVTAYDAQFANNFSVTRTGPAPNANTFMVIRMNTPNPSTAPDFAVVSIGDKVVGSQVTLQAESVPAVEEMAAVISSLNAGPVLELFKEVPSIPVWTRSFVLLPNLTPGPRTIPFYAINDPGDVQVRTRDINVRPRGWRCDSAPIVISVPTPGSTVTPYDTTFGGLEGPWTNACWSTAPTGGNDVWLQWTPTLSGTATISTCNADTGFSGAQPDTLVGIVNTCSQSSFSACADDTPGCGFGTRLSNIPIVANQTYAIGVRGFSGEIPNGLIAVSFFPSGAPTCDGLDFNNDDIDQDPTDIEAFLSVYSGGPCL